MRENPSPGKIKVDAVIVSGNPKLKAEKSCGMG